ncbi:clathrin-adaptor gamma chain [Nannochloropsis gaditana]|uniref:AP-1 complex subunit gamma n=2 Tax=Nannochloropsis gaditana TaxID=72520 RepID=W7TQP3_9STRA|nr:clathrin-adaptor gamma chain [Nannochloropsis gaditana]
MTMRLRELIRAVRACKTAAEERAVIAKESALIRTAIKEEHEQYRHRNVAKLLFIHMLGYPSHFGQMECLKLIASPHFFEKRIGYLGLSLLLTEQEEVLTLVTNSIKNDLNSPNPFVVGLALSAVGNLATEDIARDLAMDVDKHLKSNNSYLRKKAALATIRIFQKVPDLVEDFIERITSLLKDRSHGVLIAAVELMTEVMKMDPAFTSAFSRLVPSVLRLLRNLLTMGYAPDHDIAGITDPFLQVKLLYMLQCLGRDNAEASEAMNDLLAQVATNTETAKNAGNAILYQCVQTIMSVESEAGLRVLGINILGRFLLNRDNNIRYVALNTLSKVVGRDAASVQRHRNTIVECLKDPDVSIRQRALELICQLVNPQNVQELTREMLNYLVVALPEHKASLCSKIMHVVETYAPSPLWRLDTLITMLAIAGDACDPSIPHALVYYLSTAEDLQRYAVHKLFLLLTDDASQLGLVLAAVWAIGEFGDLLLQAQPALDEDTSAMEPQTPAAVLDALEEVVTNHGATQVTRGYVLVALLKLSDRFAAASPSVSDAEMRRLAGLLSRYDTSLQLELQQRSCEFRQVLAPGVEGVRPEIVGRIPPLDEAMLTARRGRFPGREDGGGKRGVSMEGSLFGEEGTGKKGGKEGPAASGGATDLLDLEEIFGGAPGPGNGGNGMTGAVTGGASLKGGESADLLSDIFASNVPVAMPASAPVALSTPFDQVVVAEEGHLPHAPPPSFSSSSSLPPPTPSAPLPPALPQQTTASITAFDQDGLRITMELSKPSPADDPSASLLLCRFDNRTDVTLTNLSFQCAVPRYVKLELSPASGSTLLPNTAGSVTQAVRVANSLLGQKPLQLKIKVQYTDGRGQPITKMGTVANFPAGY